METQNSVVAKIMLMSETAWSRHANPWSVWTRITTCLPLLTLSLWSRSWIGIWSIFPIFTALLWIWINPRVFPEPKSIDNWASQGVLGERIWLNRKIIPIAKHHVIAANTLLAIGATGILPYAYGIWRLSIWPTTVGFLLMYLGKLWYFDRMVWLYKEQEIRLNKEEKKGSGLNN